MEIVMVDSNEGYWSENKSVDASFWRKKENSGEKVN